MLDGLFKLFGGETKKATMQAGTASACAPYIVKTKAKPKQCLIKSKKTKKCIKYKQVKLIKSVHKDSCLTPDVLKLLVNAWNAEHPRDRIQLDQPLSAMWVELHRKIKATSTVPLAEIEWLKQDWVRDALTAEKTEKLKDKLYRPEEPDEWKTNRNAWLSTTDIEDVLVQYETKFPTFKFYGASPIDFDLKDNTGSCAVNSLCNIDLMRDVKKDGKEYIGVVFNLDKHNQSGSHWISLFINIPKKEINFWDSFALPPPAEVNKLMGKVKTQALSKLGLKMKINVNKNQHQYKNSECGVYSINFIVQQLEGNSFSSVVNKIITDDDMNKKRRDYYSA